MNTDLLTEDIHAAISKQIDRVMEEEIQKAKINIEDRLREELGKLAIQILGCYQIERMGTELRITVKNWESR